ncbi:MAG: hypothetical protein HUJ26_23935 [Planctomycetaceae bacterium]|nr:hypothetical protein [Planctomycetaceae bacterium]
MLISKDLRKQLTVLALGSSLMAGCSSGPEMRFTRFWPGRDKPKSAAEDEAMADKWRERLAASGSSRGEEGLKSANAFDVAKAEQETQESRDGGLNLFRRFSRRNEEENKDISDAQRAALERRIAELEAEQKDLMVRRSAQQDRRLTEASRPEASRPDPSSDPFLAASRRNQLTTPQNPVKQTVSETLPAWARENDQTNATAAAPIKESAPSNAGNKFDPSFEETLRELQASAEAAEEAEELAEERDEVAVTEEPSVAAPFPARKYPENLETEQTVAKHLMQDVEAERNPFADQNPFAEQDVARSEPSDVAVSEPQPHLETPITEPGDEHPLTNHKTTEEQRLAYAHLEVQQLMKRSRIQARAGQFEDALATAISAEQLANNADVEFGRLEQTPAQLISLIKMKSGESQNIAAREPVQQPGRAKVITRPMPQSEKSAFAVRPQVDTDSPLPEWPGNQAVTQPKQVVDNSQPASTTRFPRSSAADDQFRTAEFLNPRPSQATSPATTASTENWSSRKEFDTPQSTGRFMELRSAPARGNKIQAQLVSSSNIYSPENLQWTKLDASLATIRENDPVPMPAKKESFNERPVFADEVADSEMSLEEENPFDGFDEAEIVETTLVSDAPLSEDAPEAPVVDAESTETAVKTIFGIPVQKLGLVGLAGLILMAAIYHRRRTFGIHEH